MSTLADGGGEDPQRPYTVGTFQVKLNKFEELIRDVTYQDAEATPEERRQWITVHMGLSSVTTGVVVVVVAIVVVVAVIAVVVVVVVVVVAGHWKLTQVELDPFSPVVWRKECPRFPGYSADRILS
ncbi:WD repeat-containing protein 64 [Elysia marginata]|uniref:WD repeat-containing protein 64 n=1 Tax=Elysia marginata TaxID=1093978 RepID=A0AAV4F3V3_9GAST|nr:WD repeat-containing protein 64 [Elysia marginata]